MRFVNPFPGSLLIPTRAGWIQKLPLTRSNGWPDLQHNDRGENILGSPVDERQMIQRLVARQASAWSDFVAQYQSLVASRVKHTATQCHFDLDGAEIEDICAEVFASLIVHDCRSLRQFRGQCRLSTWLGVIARRVCLRQLSHLRDSLGGKPEQLRSDPYQSHDDLLAELIETEQYDAIDSHVARLNESDRLILDLYFQQELSYAEIGRKAGISINSVGPKLNRAVARLRKLVRRV